MKAIDGNHDDDKYMVNPLCLHLRPRILIVMLDLP